jgi:tRNA (guanine9-N1)-methyltransferase
MSGNAETRKAGEKLIPPEGMTKSAYKKMLRKKRHEETKEQYREHRKQLKKERDAGRREEIEKLKANGEPYEHLLKPRNKNKITKSIDNGDEKIEISPIDINKKIGIVIDCAYDDYMNEKEVVSLSSQITRAYSSNRQAVKAYYSKEIERKQNGEDEKTIEMDIAPAAKLVISGLNKRLKQRFDKVLPDYQKWDPECAVFSESSLENVLNKWKDTERESNDEIDYSNVIYLSADTEEKITELKPGEVYVVGGIVDKGRHKNLCKGTAEKLGKGIRILRLPIDEYIKLSGRKVLTTAHVVELLLKWCEYKDWKRAFEEVLPPRKMGNDEEDTKEDYEENSNE